MRTALGSLLAVGAALAMGCGGSSGTELAPDTLDHDAAAAFAGPWYGTATLALGGRTQESPGLPLDVTVTGRNQLHFPGLCGDGSGPDGRVTSDTEVTVAAHPCPIPLDAGCTVTWQLSGGSGSLRDGVFSLTVKGPISGCGVSGDMTLSFSGTKSPGGAGTVDHGPPVAVTSSSVATQPGVPVTLDATASSDPDGRPLSYSWTVTSWPPTAAPPPLANPTTAQPTFSAMVLGDYGVMLTVWANDGQSASTTATIHVSLPGVVIPALGHEVLQAAYTRALDRLVMTDGGSAAALYVYDPVAKTEVTVALPLPPTCLSLGPDGTHALVGHNAWLSYVDLAAPQLVKTISVPTDVGACALGDGWAYAFPSNDWNAVVSVELATGSATPNTIQHYAGSSGVLTPDGRTLYADTKNQSPMDLKRWDVSGGVATYAWEMAYHGDYAVGEVVWMDPSGARVFTSAGTAFHASDVQAQDMTYAGALSLSGSTPLAVAHLDLSGAQLAAIPRAVGWDPTTLDKDTTIELFDPVYLGHTGTLAIPRWAVGAGSYAAHGRFVFYSADGTRRYAIVQADATSGLSHDTAVLTF